MSDRARALSDHVVHRSGVIILIFSAAAGQIKSPGTRRYCGSSGDVTVAVVVMLTHRVLRERPDRRLIIKSAICKLNTVQTVHARNVLHFPRNPSRLAALFFAFYSSSSSFFPSTRDVHRSARPRTRE